MKLSDFDFDLPPSAIAQEPAADRDGSRLMVLERASGQLAHRTFGDLPDLLAPGDLLVVNRTRVIPARLIGRRSSGGRAELLLVRRRSPHCWEALVKPGRRLRPGEQLHISDELAVRIETNGLGPDGRRQVRLLPAAGDAADEDLLQRHGSLPLPPYIRRPVQARDAERYQTVFAREAGSVAAPTAGLHFTPALLARLGQRGVGVAELILHVGPGTFKPVEVEEVEDHRVEPEDFELPPETAAAIRQAQQAGRRVIAVGTTTTRVIETAAGISTQLEARTGRTDLVILPGFQFRTTAGLVTNFHLPRSSLLLLVCAFANRERILSAYAEAIRVGYRFYSYGDAMLIL